MPRVLDADELKLLRDVERLGATGLTQTGIARELEMPLETLRSRVARLGLELTAKTEIRSILGGRTFTDLISSGELIADPEPAPAEAVR